MCVLEKDVKADAPPQPRVVRRSGDVSFANAQHLTQLRHLRSAVQKKKPKKRNQTLHPFACEENIYLSLPLSLNAYMYGQDCTRTNGEATAHVQCHCGYLLHARVSYDAALGVGSRVNRMAI